MREVKIGKWKGEPFKFAHCKRDGLWLSLVKHPETGVATAWSRQPREMTQKLLWHPTFAAFEQQADPGTILWCEVWVVGSGRDAVKGAIRDELDTVRIECFASPTLCGAGAHLESVQEIVEAACGVPFVPWRADLCEYDELMGMIAPDTEGWVLKDGNTLNWRRLKGEETYDLLVVGKTRGRNHTKYEGMLGALVLESANGRQVKCSGMTDEQRIDMTNHFEKYLGQIVEVRCQGRGSAGGLAHPRFVCVREDKTEPDTLE